MERQLELGVDFTKYRAYDPAIGRWWQIDPAADMAGQESWNPYHYSLNNPVRWNDPFGDCVNGNCADLEPSGPSASASASDGTATASASLATVNVQATDGNSEANIQVGVVQGTASATGDISTDGVTLSADASARGLGYDASVDGENASVSMSAELGKVEAEGTFDVNLEKGATVGGRAGAYAGKVSGSASYTVPESVPLLGGKTFGVSGEGYGAGVGGYVEISLTTDGFSFKGGAAAALGFGAGVSVTW